mgnify:CR=1 FL=1|tara:strand:- start:10 stop:282 length:273 start_codon:yes stop_codon:yes gene_type:complete
MPDTKKMSGPELPSSEEERMNKLRYEFNKEVEEAINTSNDLRDFKRKYKPYKIDYNSPNKPGFDKAKSKKAKGGYVKKYAKGGGVRKVRS